MSKFGWSYPAGVNRLPGDDAHEPSEKSLEICEKLEGADVDYELIDSIIQYIDELESQVIYLEDQLNDIPPSKRVGNYDEPCNRTLPLFDEYA